MEENIFEGAKPGDKFMNRKGDVLVFNRVYDPINSCTKHEPHPPENKYGLKVEMHGECDPDKVWASTFWFDGKPYDAIGRISRPESDGKFNEYDIIGRYPAVKKIEAGGCWDIFEGAKPTDVFVDKIGNRYAFVGIEEHTDNFERDSANFERLRYKARLRFLYDTDAWENSPIYFRDGRLYKKCGNQGSAEYEDLEIVAKEEIDREMLDEIDKTRKLIKDYEKRNRRELHEWCSRYMADCERRREEEYWEARGGKDQ